MNDQQRLELEAAAFRRLVAHLDSRKDVQNIDLMNLALSLKACIRADYFPPFLQNRTMGLLLGDCGSPARASSPSSQSITRSPYARLPALAS